MALWKEEGNCTLKAASLYSHELLLNTFTESHSCLSGDILAEKVLFHPFHGLVQVLLGQDLATDNIPEQATDSTQT